MFVIITSKIYWLFYFPVPGSVISPVAFSFGKDWIHLRWSAPYPPLGEVEVYKVEYKLQSSWSYNVKDVSINKTYKLWDGNICFKLDSSNGIIGNEVYNIKVSDTAVISWLWEMKMYTILSLMEGFVSAVPKSIITSISKWQLSLWTGFDSISFVLSMWMNDNNKLGLF